jgi:c-di-GMP-binding flagellar brake protein YcgR
LEPLVGADHADFDRILEVAQRYAISHAPKDVPQAAAGLMRATARASLDVPIRYRVGEGEFMTGRATNISLGGLHMVAGAGLKPGSPISLRFTLASNEVTQRGKELALQARVVAHQPNPDGSFNYNIAFHSVPNEEHDQIGTYVANTLRSAAV